MEPLMNELSVVLANGPCGPRLGTMVLEAPGIAARVRPGQFVHMKIPGMEGHILRRPFSVYAADPMAGALEVLYQEVGFGTRHLATLPAGARVELLGPTGNTWGACTRLKAGERPRMLLVGGGVGAAPLFMLAQELVGAGCTPDVVLGAQTEAALACLGRYRELLGTEPCCATDDGSYGRAGFCTSLVEERLACGYSQDGRPYDQVAVCGPEPLMRIVADMCAQAGVACQVSLEKRMACGVGACLSCVVDTVGGKKRSCVDGPVFDAQEVVW